MYNWIAQSDYKFPALFYISKAFNKIGSGDQSQPVKVTTKGSRPLIPNGYQFLEPNAMSIRINLASWDPPDCPVSLFIIEYKVKSSSSSWSICKSAQEKRGEEKAYFCLFVSSVVSNFLAKMTEWETKRGWNWNGFTFHERLGTFFEVVKIRYETICTIVGIITLGQHMLRWLGGWWGWWEEEWSYWDELGGGLVVSGPLDLTRNRRFLRTVIKLGWEGCEILSTVSATLLCEDNLLVTCVLHGPNLTISLHSMFPTMSEQRGESRVYF